MSINPNLLANHHRLDDEACESIACDSPEDRTTNPNAADETLKVLDEIKHCAYSGNEVRTLALMEWLLRSELPIFVDDLRTLTRAFRSVVYDCPKPVVADAVIEHRFLLDKIINLAKQYEADGVVLMATTLRYRIYEACGEYEHARTLIDKLRDQTDKEENCFQFAQLTNNYGYEFLLEDDYLEAKPYFIESLALFQSLDTNIDIANAQANLLTCQFALLPSHDWEALLPMLRKAQRVLYLENDWRIRKTMRLFAALAEARQRHTVAIAWARRAANASRHIPTQLHLDDITYLESLHGKRLQGDLFGHRVNTQQADDCPEGLT